MILLNAIALTLAVAAPPANGTIVAKGAPVSAEVAVFAQWRNPDAAKALLEKTTVEPITYISDGLKVNGYLARPKAEGTYPAVIFCRGGNREFGAMTDESAVMQLAKIASWGYVAVASQYRGNAGGEGREEFGGSDVNDVLNLVPLLEGAPQVDAKRIGIYGWSRGGMMTYLALARTTRFSAAVVGAGMSDAFESIAARPQMETVFRELAPNYDKEKEAQLAARSAIRWPDKLAKNTPILLLHGTADWRVSPSETLAMASALLKVKHPYRLIMFEGGDHGLSEFRKESDAAVREWLDRYVRDQQKWPSLEPHGR